MIGLHCPVGIQSWGHWIELPGNCVWRWPHNPDLSLRGFHDKHLCKKAATAVKMHFIFDEPGPGIVAVTKFWYRQVLSCCCLYFMLV